jgi:hypothetical protein
VANFWEEFLRFFLEIFFEKFWEEIFAGFFGEKLCGNLRKIVVGARIGGFGFLGTR